MITINISNFRDYLLTCVEYEGTKKAFLPLACSQAKYIKYKTIGVSNLKCFLPKFCTPNSKIFTFISGSYCWITWCILKHVGISSHFNSI